MNMSEKKPPKKSSFNKTEQYIQEMEEWYKSSFTNSV